MKTQILSCLPNDFPWKNKIFYFDTLDSTNTYAKIIAAQGAPHGTVVIAGCQTAGRGRMGRSFHSPQNHGIYLSLILRPDCPADKLMHLTCAVGVAMCQAVQDTAGIRPGIKWINDLILGGKKLGGILTALSFTADGKVDYAIVGIGINCSQFEPDFPPELREIATSVLLSTGKPVSRALLAGSMIRQLHRMDTMLLSDKEGLMNQYRQDCVTIGKEVVVHSALGQRNGYACDIDPEGALLVRFPDGHYESLHSGEASVRGMCGYA